VIVEKVIFMAADVTLFIIHQQAVHAPADGASWELTCHLRTTVAEFKIIIIRHGNYKPV
jgi:hypothetical protein